MSAKEKLFLRLANEKDMDLLFNWANDPETRNQAFSTEPIEYESHKKWFAKLMGDSNQVQYIYMLNDTPIGQIRFFIQEDSAIIDYSIAKDKRGLGYGKMLLLLGREEICKSYPEIKALIGQVKTGNIASEKCFSKCGYTERFKQFELSVRGR